MKRWLFNILGAVSLLLALAVAGLWVRGGWLEAHATIYGISSEFVASCIGGDTQLEWIPMGFASKGTHFNWRYLDLQLHINLADDCRWNILGFGFHSRTDSVSPVPVWRFVVPFWFSIVSSFILPLFWIYRRRFPRYKPGLCQKCGYDLRASKGECPECGAKIPAAEAKASVK
jgi:hypothetical protein